MSAYSLTNKNKITKKKQKKKFSTKNIKIIYQCYDLLPDPIIIAKKDKVLYVNPEACKLFGLEKPKTVFGKSIFKLISFTSDSDRDTYMHKIKETCFKQFDCKINCTDGHTVNVYLKLRVCNINSKTYNFITIEDVSKMKILENESNTGKELYKKLLNISPDAICLHDGHNFCFPANTLVKMLKYNDSLDIMGKSIIDILPKEYHNHFNDRMKKILNSDEILPDSKYKFINSKNNLIDVECKSVRLYLNGRYVIISSIRDVTEKNKLIAENLKAEANKELLEKTLEYDKLKTEFFSNISHELRTPLNILLSSLQLLNLYLKDEIVNIKPTKKYLSVMKQNCFRLLRLINNLLDITKIDSGFYNLNLCNRNIIAVVENITLSVADYLKNKKINIIFDTDIEEKIIACDEEKIERIILNLLSNSIKFTDVNGTINVNIYDGKDYIKICIIDDGIGIPKEKLNTIFDRFIQIDKSLTRNSKGTGIGLALVKSLVELHNGKIQVESEYGKGCKFTILLPVKIIASEDQSNLYGTFIDTSSQDTKIEKMNIEFSDIYF
ncbi:PAS domain-containing sensor histidine kinase [Clostridium pasteurianum]|uniref:histidine kinase n=1 Tax=Clostridium pasteurianum BC1 TaxID=86416 RepID=R4K367_CLOPA|nr:ATP-binding protein [Clostridium pasteurianum]AGK96186.1 PAS domain S-box [Clostridium pasteurianum BC1]